MWAKFKKTNETPSKVSYDYGFESHKLTGKIEFNKETKEIKFIKYAEKGKKYIGSNLPPYIIESTIPIDNQGSGLKFNEWSVRNLFGYV